MSDRIILKSFQKLLISAGASVGIPVKVRGVTFDIPNDQKYVEIVLIPNNDGGEYWGDDEIFKGIVRLITHWPNDNAGAYSGMDTAAAVAGFFTKGLILRREGLTIRVTKIPIFKGEIVNENDTQYPYSFTYLAS